MNGIFLHGGFAPNGATFLVFTDYARPAMRLAALMGTGVVYVMTHDSIGLGEDGPTHQPVEHLAALRAIPNMRVFRPCDAIETAECWELALSRTDGPTRAGADAAEPAAAPHHGAGRNPCAMAPTSWSPRRASAQVSLFASGSEVEIAVAAQKQLAERGIADTGRLGALAGIAAGPAGRPAAGHHRQRPRQGRDRGRRTLGLGRRDRPGRHLHRHARLSARARPAKDLFKHFGITAEAAVNAVPKRLARYVEQPETALHSI